MCGFCYPEDAPAIRSPRRNVPVVCIHGHGEDDAHVCSEKRATERVEAREDDVVDSAPRPAA